MMHLVQDRLNEELVVWCLTLDDRLFHRRPYNGTFGVIEGKRIANKTNVEKPNSSFTMSVGQWNSRLPLSSP